MKPANVNVSYQVSDAHEFLVAKGDVSKEDILKAAIEQRVIEEGDFAEADFFQSHYKTVPAPANWGYRTWSHPISKPCRGSYFASVLRQ